MLGFGGSFVFLVEEPNAWLPALWILVVVIVAGIFGSALWAPKRGAQRSRWYSQLFRREKDRRRTPPRGREAHPQGGSTAEMAPAARGIEHAGSSVPAHARAESADDRSNVAVLLYDRESEPGSGRAEEAGVPPSEPPRVLTVVESDPTPPADETISVDEPAHVSEDGPVAADEPVSEDEPVAPATAHELDAAADTHAEGAATAVVEAEAATALHPRDPAEVAAVEAAAASAPAEADETIEADTDTGADHVPAAAGSDSDVAADEATSVDEPAHGPDDPHVAEAETDADDATASFVVLDELRHVLDGLAVNTQAFEHDLTWFLERSAVPTEMPNWPIEHQLHLAEQAAAVLADPLMELLRRARDISETIREIDVLVGERTLTSASIDELSSSVEAIAVLCPDLARLRRRFDGLGADFDVLRGMADTVSGIVAIIEATLDVAAGLGGQVFDVAAAGRRFGLHVLR